MRISLGLFARRQPRWERAYDEYLLMLRTCRSCGTVHPAPEDAGECEFNDATALQEAALELWRDRNIPGHAHRECDRCGEPLSEREREEHMEAWRLHAPAEVPPALCDGCLDLLEAEDDRVAEAQPVEAEMRAALYSVIRVLEERKF